MKKGLHYLFVVVSLLTLTACKAEVIEYEYTGEYTVQFYYVEGCSMCEDFKEHGIDFLKDEFGDNLNIVLFDMNDTDSKEPYDQMINVIDTSAFEGEYYGMAPMFYLEGYFAKLGIYKDEYKYLVEDIRSAMNGEEYTMELQYNRALVITDE